MFAASAVLFLSVLSLASDALAKPLTYRREAAMVLRNAPSLALQLRDGNNTSVNNTSVDNSTSGFNSSILNNVSQFNGGQDNFNGLKNGQKIVIKEVSTQCKDIKVEIVQQKLAILQELAKKIITEQICDVQTQTIVLAQHNGALEVFRDDIQRKTVARQVGFDEQITSKFNQIVNADGSLTESDNGFTGQDVGQNTVVPVGNNWNNATSPPQQPSIDAGIQQALNVTQ